jgi:hypothetical protein
MQAKALFSRLLLAALVLSPATIVPLAAQQGPGSGQPLRTADGQPDIQGVWDFRTLTPLQRPEDLADQTILTDEAAAAIEAEAAQRVVEADAPSEIRTEPLPVGGNVGGYNNFWFDRGAGVVDDRRTSLIVDPTDGRLPALVNGTSREGGSAADDTTPTRPVRFRVDGIGLDGPEDRGLAERCLLGFNTGPPITPGGYNQNLQVFQSPGYVAILNEMVHDTRIVPLDGRPHLPGQMKQWMGDSRGSWEGDTLVVETLNFTDKTASFSPNVRSAVGTGTTLRLTERFTRIDEDTLRYEYTVDDPETFARPFTAALQMKRGQAPLFEYACHEGNYGLQNILAGARVDEQRVAP